MMSKVILSLFALFISIQSQANVFDDVNPFDPSTEQALQKLDQLYSEETGLPAQMPPEFIKTAGCERFNCPLWILVDKPSQTVSIYIDGVLESTWKTSTGRDGYETPNFDRHPNGRIYEAYMSRSYPSADINGLGNMPYAIFIEGGFAIHGTDSLWRLGTAASHGCIRLEPANAKVVNTLVRQYGIYKTWITVQ
jgi:L,D-transpeptidase catalytic domain